LTELLPNLTTSTVHYNTCYNQVTPISEQFLAFLTQSALLLKAVLSVCLSVRLSVTMVIHAYAVQGIDINFIPYGRAIYF